MRKEAILIGLLGALLVASLTSGTACKVGPQFEISSLTVTPTDVVAGETFTVTAEIANVGDSESTFTATLTVDEETVDTQEMTLAAGDTETVTFSLTRDAGTYTIGLDGVSETLTVLRPAEFEVSFLAITPAVPGVWEEVTVTASVENIGDVEGTCAVTLTVDGVAEETKDVTVAGNDTETVTFSLTRDAGTYTIGLDGVSETLTVLRPAEFEVSSLAMTPALPRVWEEVTVTASVKNIGDVEGTCAVTLTVDGVAEETKDVTVVGSDTETVTFSLVRHTGGSYEVEVDGLTHTLTVTGGVLPTLHVGDQWVRMYVIDGVDYTQTSLVTREERKDGKDCYVVNVSWDPPLWGMIERETAWRDKATYYTVRQHQTGRYWDQPYIRIYTCSYLFPGLPPWPKKVGKEFEIVQTYTHTTTVMGRTTTDTGTISYAIKVEKLEEITVPAGTFECFRQVRYDGYGIMKSVWWYSDEAKYSVKWVDLDSDQSHRLVSLALAD